MNKVVEKDLRIEALKEQVHARDASINIAHTELSVLRSRLAAAERKKAWWRI